MDLQIEKAEDFFCSSLFECRVDFNHKNLTKIHIKYNDLEYSNKMQKFLEDKYKTFINIYLINSNSLEMISKSSSKYKAIKLLSEKIGISKESIYTVGDSYSDIEMIKNYNGFVMKESIKELENISKEKVDSVSDVIKKIM